MKFLYFIWDSFDLAAQTYFDPRRYDAFTRNGPQRDVESLAGDFVVVGNDMRAALRNYAAEQSNSYSGTVGGRE